VAHCRSHPAHLTVLALDEFETDATVGHGLAQANRRLARGDCGLRFEQPRGAQQGVAVADGDPGFQLRERISA
jgi:hypothetical protein